MKTFMKNRWALILFLMLISFPLSESFSQSKVQVGPFWGQGIRMITGNEEVDIGPGFHGGIMARIPFDEQLSLVPSISIARKGYYNWDMGWWEDGSEDIHSFNQKLTYLDFYLPVKYRVAGIFNVQAGFQMGVLLDGELVVDSYDDSEKFKRNLNDQLNPLEFGFIVGGGVLFKNGIGLDLMVNQGLTKIYENDPPLYLDPDDYFYYGSEFDGKNLLTTINVYYLFGYHKPAAK